MRSATSSCLLSVACANSAHSASQSTSLITHRQLVQVGCHAPMLQQGGGFRTFGTSLNRQSIWGTRGADAWPPNALQWAAENRRCEFSRDSPGLSNESWGRSWPAGGILERRQLRVSHAGGNAGILCYRTRIELGLAMSSPVSGILLLCENNTSST